MRYDPAVATGRDHYNALFEQKLLLEAEWLRRGAGHKVDSLHRLLTAVDARPETLIELGAGTGAVLDECRRRGLAREYIAVDYSAPALQYLSALAPDIRTIVADLMDPTLTLPRADLLLLSHVLEHLEEPAALLQSLQARDFTYLAVEVPLDDLPVRRMLTSFRDRVSNPAGHVQFFRGPDVDQLVRSTGFEIVARHRYAPIFDAETIRFAATRNGVSAARRTLQLLTGCVFPSLLGPVWARWYYAHYAVLCRRAR